MKEINDLIALIAKDHSIASEREEEYKQRLVHFEEARQKKRKACKRIQTKVPYK